MTARPDSAAQDAARQVIGLAAEHGQSIAVAESLTGGLLAAALTGIPGASAAFRGGVVSYATDLKATVLGVPADLLERHGAVHPGIAAAMAAGVRGRLGATVGAATTGAAGPDPADGQPAGTVYIAVSSRRGTEVRSLTLHGSRDEVRRETVTQCLRLLVAWLREESA